MTASRAWPGAWPVAAGAALLLVAGLGAGGGPLLRLRTTTAAGLPLPQSTEPADRPTPTLLPTPSPGGPRARTGGGPDVLGLLQTVGLVAAVLVGLGLLALAVHAVRRRAPTAGPDAPAAGTLLAGGTAPAREQLARAVEQAGAQLSGGDGPRERVLACWLRLEQSVAATGVVRGPAETSSELTRRLLSEHAVAVGTLDELHGLYRAARYSAREVGPDRPERAGALLGEVRRDLLGAP